MLSDAPKKKLKNRMMDLLWVFLLFAFASAITSGLSYFLQYLPWIGFSEEQFLKNGQALPDMTVARILFANWCLAALFALWWKKARVVAEKFGTFLEDAAVALLGAMFGLFVVSSYETGGAPLVQILLTTLSVFAVAAVVRINGTRDTDEFAFARWLGTLGAVSGLWWGLTYPNTWPLPF